MYIYIYISVHINIYFYIYLYLLIHYYRVEVSRKTVLNDVESVKREDSSMIGGEASLDSEEASVNMRAGEASLNSKEASVNKEIWVEITSSGLTHSCGDSMFNSYLCPLMLDLFNSHRLPVSAVLMCFLFYLFISICIYKFLFIYMYI
jgi:hypothetical protein